MKPFAWSVCFAILCLSESASAVTFGRRKPAEQATIEHFSPSTNDDEPAFWYNYVTQETQYDKPNIFPTIDKVTNQPYWVVDGKATWDRPAEADWRELMTPNDQPYFRNDQLDLTVWERPPELGWRKLSTEKYFFKNEATGETKWPESFPPEFGTYDIKTKTRYYTDAKTGKSTWDPPNKEAAWRRATDPSTNREYFFNTITNERSWTVPENSHIAWVAHPKNLEF